MYNSYGNECIRTLNAFVSVCVHAHTCIIITSIRPCHVKVTLSSYCDLSPHHDLSTSHDPWPHHDVSPHHDLSPRPDPTPHPNPIPSPWPLTSHRDPAPQLVRWRSAVSLTSVRSLTASAPPSSWATRPTNGCAPPKGAGPARPPPPSSSCPMRSWRRRRGAQPSRQSRWRRTSISEWSA